MIEFQAFAKIPRYARDCIVSEKIDGTNAQIIVHDVYQHDPVEQPSIPWVWKNEGGVYIFAGSTNRFIMPENDNHGFAKWVQDNAQELVQLGPGRHFGEWWGQGINRGYGLKEKRFSLFNVIRWDRQMFELYKIGSWEKNGRPGDRPVYQYPPGCCHTVPVVDWGMFSNVIVENSLAQLWKLGSVAEPGFEQPEGVVVFHKAGNCLFKKTLVRDEEWKGGGRKVGNYA